MRKEYDDKEWYNGLGAWGAENRPYPIHSTWTVADIYIRRHFNINDKKKLEDINYMFVLNVMTMQKSIVMENLFIR